MHDDDDLDHVHGSGPPRFFFAAVNVFLVDDIEATVEYYRDILGFEIDFVYGDPPIYGSVSRNDAILNFSRSDPAGRRNGIGSAGPGNGVDALIVVSDVDDIYTELKERGAKTLSEPRSQDYGMREFHIEDLNSYRLAIAAEIDL
ncbi:MAG: hypothetical protein GEU75_14680 [Dehalococcoidia bacterium]|nr:hypothetical protein [Dehalococcoidia bacterium]